MKLYVKNVKSCMVCPAVGDRIMTTLEIILSALCGATAIIGIHYLLQSMHYKDHYEQQKQISALLIDRLRHNERKQNGTVERNF